jgi:guanine deaminase
VTDLHQSFLRVAIGEAEHSLHHGGGPFGAVIVRDGQILARGQNRVTASLDPTAHAEVVAIRAACSAIGDHRLHGTTLYASTEPCPLCLSAVYWARIDRVYFAASRHDAAAAGFDDAELYRELELPMPARKIQTVQIDVPGAERPLTTWKALENKVPY